MTLFAPVLDYKNRYLDDDVLPALIRRFVRDRRAKLRLRTTTDAGSGLDRDSAWRAASLAQAAGLHDELWQFYYAFRGVRETSGDVAAMQSTVAGLTGVDARTTWAEASSHRVAQAIRRADREAKAMQITGPALVVTAKGRTRVIDLGGMPDSSDVMTEVRHAMNG